MILLLGGTAETAEITETLARIPVKFFVSTATDEPMNLPANPNIIRITGRMNQQMLEQFIISNSIAIVICAVHPYAQQARENARLAALACNVSFAAYLRRESKITQSAPNINFFDDHFTAANYTCKKHQNILLTTGSRNLKPYIAASEKYGCNLTLRLLDCEESRKAVASSGLSVDNVFFARGPFSYKDNIQLLQTCQATALVSKDGGVQGGCPEKISAAADYGAELILIKRPEYPYPFYNRISDLTEYVINLLQTNGVR